MSGQWHGGKGSRYKKVLIDKELWGLKYDLPHEKDPVKKAEIKRKIAELEASKK